MRLPVPFMTAHCGSNSPTLLNELFRNLFWHFIPHNISVVKIVFIYSLS